MSHSQNVLVKNSKHTKAYINKRIFLIRALSRWPDEDVRSDERDVISHLSHRHKKAKTLKPVARNSYPTDRIPTLDGTGHTRHAHSHRVRDTPTATRTRDTSDS